MVLISIGLDSQFLRNNQFWKICAKSQVISQMFQFLQIWFEKAIMDTFFGNILGLGAYFSIPILLWKPWVQASQFEYCEPYNPYGANLYIISSY